MARRPLPGILQKTGAQPAARGRDLVRTATDGVCDVAQPLIVLARGLGRLTSAARTRWRSTPKDRRGTVALTGLGLLVSLALVPYGPVLAAGGLLAAAAWLGRRGAPVAEGPDESQRERLRALYEALVPYFGAEADPDALYAHGGDWTRALTDAGFGRDGRLSRLTVAYPPYFTDGEPEARARVEQVLYARCGRGREYRFTWDEEAGRLALTVLDPLPVDIAAQAFVTSPGETVLGFTDPDAVARTVPVTDDSGTRDASPVLWRTGPRSSEPHLLVLGRSGAGVTTLLRSVALQALPHGDVLLVDGGGAGEYAYLAGRPGVMGVEDSLAGAEATLEWAAHETERRLIIANRARQSGRTAPADARRPLWLLLDRPSALSHLAAVEKLADPQHLLQVPLRHGRSVGVTVVIGEHLDAAPQLAEAARSQVRARVVLGPVDPAEVTALLGAPPLSTPAVGAPAGRGYVRLGDGPVLRLQVPATPDPFDESASPEHRQAVLALLPRRPGPADGRTPSPGAVHVPAAEA
ncbi:hypothetical protein ACFV3R_09010 [Streptomyces sp. NPDC059740]|uniref:hypothetical protein n=1 Tax=Streptomyces sp. NPDC059740 TaxID=3346926 RepID=UPI0036528AEE